MGRGKARNLTQPEKDLIKFDFETTRMTIKQIAAKYDTTPRMVNINRLNGGWERLDNAIKVNLDTVITATKKSIVTNSTKLYGAAIQRLAQNELITRDFILAELLTIATNKFNKPSDQLKALELLGKEIGMFKKDNQTIDHLKNANVSINFVDKQ